MEQGFNDGNDAEMMPVQSSSKVNLPTWFYEENWAFGKSKYYLKSIGFEHRAYFSKTRILHMMDSNGQRIPRNVRIRKW